MEQGVDFISIYSVLMYTNVEADDDDDDDPNRRAYESYRRPIPKLLSM